MKPQSLVAACVAVAIASGCADMPTMGGGTRYGEAVPPPAAESPHDRHGTIVGLEIFKADDQYQLGVGTAVGAVAGALLGRQIGSGRGRTAATIAGAAAGAAAGTVVESKVARKDVQRVTVQMYTGGQVSIAQPIDGRLRQGMDVVVSGSGEQARVVPR